MAESCAVWQSYVKRPVTDFIHVTAYEGSIVKRQLDKMTEDAISFAKLGQLAGRTDIVPVVNVYPHIVSETLTKLLEMYDYPYVIGWYFNGTKYVYSLRSDGDCDVSELAKRYNGGGHKKAAGFASIDFFIDTFEMSIAADIKSKQARNLL
jgi:oligoribonuclease NrnB/cAMP/cGMP phosphodiesterase (DHH superfamily)